jgi:hypothetical protein
MYARFGRRAGPWRWYLSAAHFVGFDVGVVDDIAGDLAEACAGVAGPRAILKFVWCAGQVVRAVPYLAVDTLRRGQPGARLRLLAAAGTLALAGTSIVAAVQLHIGPPARIDADRGFDAHDIVINNVKPTQMPIRALDARGHTVPNVGIRYERVSGDDIVLSHTGAISCGEHGDAVIRVARPYQSLITAHRPVETIRRRGMTLFAGIRRTDSRPSSTEWEGRRVRGSA